VAAGKPVYVVALDAARNRVVVGDHDAVQASRMTVRDVQWMGAQSPAGSFRALTQIRYHHAAAPATIRVTDEAAATVEFDAPQFAITPGQLAVFYEADEVLGAGWIHA